ncbi:hypothetical protein A2U01_0081620, partial [Trifolium medium]|nr:hypothetical protein [Trifolium medium]
MALNDIHTPTTVDRDVSDGKIFRPPFFYAQHRVSPFGDGHRTLLGIC